MGGLAAWLFLFADKTATKRFQIRDRTRTKAKQKLYRTGRSEFRRKQQTSRAIKQLATDKEIIQLIKSKSYASANEIFIGNTEGPWAEWLMGAGCEWGAWQLIYSHPGWEY